MKTIGRICLLFFLLSCCGKCWAEPSYQGKTLSAWLDDYGAGPRDYKPSPQADEALRQIGPEAVPYLLQLLHSTNPSSTIKVVPDTNQFSPPKPAVPAPASWDHWKAYVAFQALGPLGKSAIPDLAKLAHDDPNGSSFYPNIQAMKDISAVAGLADNSSSYVVPGEFASFHGSEVMRSPLPFLVDGEIAAWSLAAIGADAVPSLMGLLDDPSPHLKQRAAEALGLAGAAAEPAVPAIIKNLQGSDFGVRQRAADALGYVGRQPTLAIPALIDALKDSDVGVQLYAARSLGSFGDRATNAISSLLVNFTAKDYRTRGSAAIALSKISPEITAKQVVPSLFRQLEDTNSWRNGALVDLLQLNLEPDVMIPHLIKALDESNGSDNSFQVNAIQGLGKYGPAAKVAVPKLIPLLADENYFVREHATNALDKIEPGWRKGH
jgi:HEAT repeat protein